MVDTFYEFALHLLRHYGSRLSTWSAQFLKRIRAHPDFNEAAFVAHLSETESSDTENPLGKRSTDILMAEVTKPNGWHFVERQYVVWVFSRLNEAQIKCMLETLSLESVGEQSPFERPFHVLLNLLDSSRNRAAVDPLIERLRHAFLPAALVDTEEHPQEALSAEQRKEDEEWERQFDRTQTLQTLAGLKDRRAVATLFLGDPNPTIAEAAQKTLATIRSESGVCFIPVSTRMGRHDR